MLVLKDEARIGYLAIVGLVAGTVTGRASFPSPSEQVVPPKPSLMLLTGIRRLSVAGRHDQLADEVEFCSVVAVTVLF